ncbi:hypothetical protein [Streptomyces eurocidicus]|nr:hypothetical protein [Streptomyces eurocidicus]MBB5119584.1 hypothetical protein [Streptomyces eurocidicus]
MSHERPSSQSPSPDEQRDDNPFAPPPEGRPDRPWEPRERPEGREGGTDGTGQGGQGNPAGPGGQGGQGDQGGPDGTGSQSGGQPPVWGSQWSSRQPGRQDGGFGGGPGGPRRPGGQGGGPGGSGGLRWDPTDPAQRRARYALLAGMWGFFFALFSIPQVALLLGALSLYWGISSLRAKSTPRRPDPDNPAAPSPGAFRPQTTAAVSGLVTGGLALAIVAATFLFQIVYSDYYTCVDDALTQTSRQACENHLPKELRPLLGAQD